MNKYYKQSGSRPLDIPLGGEEPTTQPADRNPHPGGSDMSAYEDGMYDLPPNMRASAGNAHPGGSDVEGSYDLPPAMRGGATRQDAFGNLTSQPVPSVFNNQSANRATNNANPSANPSANQAPTRTSGPTATNPTTNFAIRQNRSGAQSNGTANFAVDPNAAKPNYTMYAPVTRQQTTATAGVRDFSQNRQAFDMNSKTLADVMRQRRTNNQQPVLNNQSNTQTNNPSSPAPQQNATPSTSSIAPTPQTEPPLEESQAALQRQSLNEMTVAAANVQNASRNNGGGTGAPTYSADTPISPTNYFEVRKAQKQKRDEEKATSGYQERSELYYARLEKEKEEDLKLLPEVYRNAVKNGPEWVRNDLRTRADFNREDALMARYNAIDREMGL